MSLDRVLLLENKEEKRYTIPDILFFKDELSINTGVCSDYRKAVYVRL